jgi:hypothetical protein
MNSSRKFIIFLILLIVTLPLYLVAQSEFIIIDNIEIFKKKERTSIKFTHMNHMSIDGVSCTDCHHRFQNGKNVLAIDELTDNNKLIFCSTCHYEKSGLMNAYHHQCIGCHNTKIKGKAAGPRMCGECHILKK